MRRSAFRSNMWLGVPPCGPRQAWILLTVCLTGCARTISPLADDSDLVAQRVVGDYQTMYSNPSLVHGMAMNLAMADWMANTGVDEGIRQWYQAGPRNEETDELSSVAKPWGDKQVAALAVGAAYLVGQSLPADSEVGGWCGQWSDRCMRSFTVGGLQLYAMQRVLGASRPGESPLDSSWSLLGDEHAASGHAYLGALPFINAAKMADDPAWRAGLYLGSTFTAWSRVNDDAHYASQAVLGWTMAYLASTAVDEPDRELANWQLEPVPVSEGIGVGLVYRR